MLFASRYPDCCLPTPPAADCTPGPAAYGCCQYSYKDPSLCVDSSSNSLLLTLKSSLFNREQNAAAKYIQTRWLQFLK